jgi:hypothetical protein
VAPGYCCRTGTVTEDPTPVVEENWAHGVDHVSSMSTLLNFDVLDGAVTKRGESIYLTIGMAFVPQVGLSWSDDRDPDPLLVYPPV